MGAYSDPSFDNSTDIPLTRGFKTSPDWVVATPSTAGDQETRRNCGHDAGYLLAGRVGLTGAVVCLLK